MSGESYVVPLVINGKEHVTEKTFEVVTPSSAKVVHRCSSATVSDADSAVDAAANAFKTWRLTTPAERREIFLKAAEVMDSRREELSQTMMQETSAEYGWCGFNIGVAIDILKDVAGRVSSIEGTFPATANPDVSAIVLKEPYGVVLSIAPWNAPYILGIRAIANPVAAGNTVVFKATELAPRTMWSIVSVFQQAGLPDGVVNSLSHAPADAAAVTSALISNPLVRKINFTGSTNVGRIIGKLAGENLKPVVLELGGKAPSIIWGDADLQLAADQCALGSFLNSGQICMSTERIIVQRSIADDFKEKFKASIEKILPATGDAPVLISKVAADKNRKLIENAVSKGASVVVGDTNYSSTSEATMRPVVLSKITKDMDIYAQESFGPSVSLFEVDTEEEALEIANDTEYGLSAAVFTEDLKRGLRLARQIDSGAVHINGMTVHDEAGLPHGGAKASGFGRFNTSLGLGEWVKTKTITFKV